MNILALHHASVLIRDLERSRVFYEQVLGLAPRTDRPGKAFDGVWYDVGEGQLHLIATTVAGAGSIPAEYPGRQRHIALKVSDLGALKARLEEAGIPMTPSQSGRPVVFCRDPDGNIFELFGEESRAE